MESLHSYPSWRSQDINKNAAHCWKYNHIEHMHGTVANFLSSPRLLHGSLYLLIQVPNIINTSDTTILHVPSHTHLRVGSLLLGRSLAINQALHSFNVLDLINSITKKITPSKQEWLHGNNLNDNNLVFFTGSWPSLAPSTLHSIFIVLHGTSTRKTVLQSLGSSLRQNGNNWFGEEFGGYCNTENQNISTWIPLFNNTMDYDILRKDRYNNMRNVPAGLVGMLFSDTWYQ